MRASKNPVLAAAVAAALTVATSSATAQPIARITPALETRPTDDTWRLRALDGTIVSFSAFRGRPVVLNVWATWCPPCVAELASFSALRDSLRADPVASGVAFVFVAPETARRVARFARRRSLTLPFYVEVDRMPEELGVRAVPTTVVLDRDGRIVLHHRGAADWNTPAMRNLLRSLAR